MALELLAKAALEGRSPGDPRDQRGSRLYCQTQLINSDNTHTYSSYWKIMTKPNYKYLNKAQLSTEHAYVHVINYKK